MDEEMTLAQSVARFEPAEDVTDLDTARRLVTALRKRIAQMAKDAEPAENEFTVFLDEEHARKVQLLYDRRKLAAEQEDDAYDEEYEFEEVFGDFVNGSIDVAWDMAQSGQDDPLSVQHPLTA